jgi:hypothetical protein
MFAAVHDRQTFDAAVSKIEFAQVRSEPAAGNLAEPRPASDFLGSDVLFKVA